MSIAWNAPDTGRPTPGAAGAILPKARTLLVPVLALVLVTPAIASDTMSLPENPIDGRFLFEEKGCNRCHGIAGSGPDIGPALGGGHFSGSFLDLGAALWNHVPGMSVAFEEMELAWPTLTPDETLRLVAFLFYIDYLGDPGTTDAGREVFRARGCVSCHRVGDRGDAIGPDLGALTGFASPLHVARAIWNHGPAMFESMREHGVRPPTFEPGDLANLSAYIRGIGTAVPGGTPLLAPGNPELGRRRFEEKGCATCHRTDSGDAGLGPDLLDRELPRSAEAIAGTMWNHAEVMRDAFAERNIPWPHFTTQELADLISYLYFGPFTDAPGNAGRGAETFSERSCAECHSGGGEVPHPGPELTAAEVIGSPAALVSAMWNHAPVMKEAVLSEGHPWPELTGDDLRDLLAHLQHPGESP